MLNFVYSDMLLLIVLGEGERCNGGSIDADDNGMICTELITILIIIVMINCLIVGESGEDESSDSKSESSSTGVVKICQEGLVCTPVGNGKSECQPAPTTGRLLKAATGMFHDH